MSLLSYFQFSMSLSITSTFICASLFKTLFCLCLCLTFCHYICVTGNFFLFVVSNYFFFLCVFHTFTSVCFFLVYVVIYMFFCSFYFLKVVSWVTFLFFLFRRSSRISVMTHTWVSRSVCYSDGKLGRERKKRKENY